MKKLTWVAVSALAGLWLIGAIAFLFEAARSLRVPDERDYGEGIVLWQAAHVTNLKTAYHSVDQYPHIVFHYPPVYHVLARTAALLTGDLLTGGRSVSILAFLVICVILASLVWRCLRVCRSRTARLIGTVCAGLLPFSLSICPWGCLMRVDVTAAALAIAGLSLYIGSRDRPALAFAAFTLFVVALYTKQTLIAAPLVCLAAAWLERPRLAWQLLAYSVCLGMAALLIFNMASAGYFIVNLFFYNQNPFTISHLISEWGRHLEPIFIIPLAAALISTAYAVARKPGLSSLASFRRSLRAGLLRRCGLIMAAYLLAALVVATATVGKEGSNVNYFMEVDLAITLLSGLFFGWTTEMGLRGYKQYPEFLVLALAAFIVQALPGIPSVALAAADLSRPERDAAVTAFVRHIDGPVYSENMTILMRGGKEVPAEPAIITCLAKASAWDQNDFLRQLTEARFRAIVVSTSLGNPERFTPDVAHAIREQYRKQVHFGFYTIYLPTDSLTAAVSTEPLL